MSLYGHIFIAVEDAMRQIFPELERDNDKLHAEVRRFFDRAVPLTREQAVGWGYARPTEREGEMIDAGI